MICRSAFFLVVCITMLFLGGCATIIDGRYQKLTVHCSSPEGVVTVVDGIEVPFKEGIVVLDRTRENSFVTFRKDGFNDSTHSFNHEVTPWWPAVDLIYGPAYPIALLVDWQTGALFRFTPGSINVILRKKE